MPSSLLHGRSSRAARYALYGASAVALLVLVLAVGLLGPLWRGNAAVEPTSGWEKRPEVQLLREYIRVDTRRGRELDGARFLARKLEQVGIDATIEEVGQRQANLWAILEGEDPRALVLHSHIDVSDIANPDAWELPPFAADTEGPWLYGRGSFDMKSIATAQLAAMHALKNSGRPLKRSVILLATSEEEIGSELGSRWILDQHPELVERFWAVLTEGGVIEAVNLEDVKYWGIEIAQKTVTPVWACHESAERLESLARELAEVETFPARRRLNRTVEAFLSSYAASRAGLRNRTLLSNPRQLEHNLRGFWRLPPYVQSLFRDEAYALPVEEDPGGGYRMKIHLLTLDDTSRQAAIETLLPTWLTHGVTLEVGAPLGSGAPSPLDHPLYEHLVTSVEAAFPGVATGPYLLSASATDARFFRARGIPAYGFSPFLLFSTDAVKADATNERIAMPGYSQGVALYVDMLLRLLT